MYEYKIKLPFKIESCSGCPFRREYIINEIIESNDKLTGTVSITKRNSSCLLKEEPIFVNESVESYNSKCPLKGNVSIIEDKKKDEIIKR